MYKLGGKIMQCPECSNEKGFDTEEEVEGNSINTKCTCLRCGTVFLYEERYTILK
jgi:transcriptional regulator NrdR family protein